MNNSNKPNKFQDQGADPLVMHANSAITSAPSVSEDQNPVLNFDTEESAAMSAAEELLYTPPNWSQVENQKLIRFELDKWQEDLREGRLTFGCLRNRGIFYGEYARDICERVIMPKRELLVHLIKLLDQAPGQQPAQGISINGKVVKFSDGSSCSYAKLQQCLQHWCDRYRRMAKAYGDLEQLANVLPFPIEEDNELLFANAIIGMYVAEFNAKIFLHELSAPR